MAVLKALILSLCIGLLGFASSAPMAEAKTYRSNPQRALDVCVQAAFGKRMVYRATISQIDVKDRNRKLVSNEVVMSVRLYGKRRNVLCVYTYRTDKAVIQATRPPVVTPLPTSALAKEAVTACIRAAQRQQLLVDNLVSQVNIRNVRREVIGSTVTLNVYQAGRPAKLVCEYDYVAKTVALQLFRP